MAARCWAARTTTRPPPPNRRRGNDAGWRVARGVTVMSSTWSARTLGAIALAAMLAPAGFAYAQAPARPDLSGFWVNQYTPDLSVALGGQPPFTDFGAERW